MACPACSESTPPGARFCPACGTALAPAPEAATDETRRVVTVVFADIVGFTALAERRDPEHVKRLIDAAFALLVADIEAHGGVVDKLLGDAVVALFGAPVAHEDDADRAVRAALTMLGSIRGFREEHPADELRLRIGVNTGEVVVGTVAGTDFTAMGDVVNIAARLQQMAPPGAVLVGDATRALCSPALRFNVYDDVQLRGRDQALRVWQAVAHDTAVVARRWQSDVAFVGRSTEFGVLRNLASIALAGQGALVAVTGEPGIGKSRLVHEVLATLAEAHPDALVLEGACAPYGESNAWWPLAGGLLSRLGIDRNQPATDARRRVARKLAAFPELGADPGDFDRLVEVAIHLLGHPSALDALGPSAIRDRVIEVISTGLRRRAAHSPVIIRLDDVQWAAPLLLESLEILVRRLADTSLLVLTTYRSGEEGLFDWPSSLDPALTLHLPLAPLVDHEVVELVQVAAGRMLPDATVRSIATRAGGNPLFVTELARLAAATDDLDAAELPGSLRALIASQLDRLTTGQRALLDNAAILGTEGRVGALRAFASEVGQSFDADDLAVIESLGLLVRDGPQWVFRSDVVREVAYGTLTKQARAQRHAGVARYLLRYGDTYVDRRAHHVATAAELVREIGPTAGVSDAELASAVGLLLAAARKAFHQGAHRRGVQLIERALGLEPVDAEWSAAMLMLAEGLVETRALSSAGAAIADVLEGAHEAGDELTIAEAMRLRGTIAQMEGDLVSARRDLGDAVGRLRILGDDAHLGEALRARGFAEVFGGSLRDAEWFLGEADEVFIRVGDDRGRAWVQQHLGWVSLLGGDHESSQRRLETAITAFDRLGDRAGATWAKGLLAYVHHFDRRCAAAERLADEVYDEARRWGDDWGASMMLNLQASIRLWAGDIEAARTLAERALVGFRRIGDRFGLIQALGTSNRALVAAGRAAEAERSIEEILVLAGAFGQMAYPAMAAAGAAMHAGHGRRAADLAADAAGHLDTTGVNIDEARVVSAFGQALAGDPDRALAELELVAVDRSPFALAARATARTMLGDRRRALLDVVEVERLASEADAHVSYWDLWIARVAGVAAADGAEFERRAADMRSELDDVSDVVVRAYARDVLARLFDEPVADHPSARALRGWSDVAVALTSHRPVATTQATGELAQ